jgi:hypothetical protein
MLAQDRGDQHLHFCEGTQEVLEAFLKVAGVSEG